MGAYKDKDTGKWYAQFRYKDWTGTQKQKCKRSFMTKKEALAWERDFLVNLKPNMNMTFGQFYERYVEDVVPKIKYNSWITKEHIGRTKILPYFKDKKISGITAADIIKWQNLLREEVDANGHKHSKTYLKTIHNQISAIFNHACMYYDLPSNPAQKAGNMGSEETKEMLFWTKSEYEKFAEAIRDKPIAYYAFELLFWTGIRSGELLALTPADFDLEGKKLRINKSYQRLRGQDIITDPKTKKSNRVIVLPDFLAEEMREFFNLFYALEPDSRLFPFTKALLHKEMDRGSKISGVKRIRIHDLRHSHISMLIHMGYMPVQIGERVGHEAETITNKYAHVYPTVQTEMADKLNIEKECATHE